MLTVFPQLEAYGMTVVMATYAELDLLTEQPTLRTNAVDNLNFTQLFALSDKVGAFSSRRSKELKDEVRVSPYPNRSLAHISAVATILGQMAELEEK
jgi:hypothetical protein